MEIIIAIVAVIAGFVVTFFQGRKSGKANYKAEQVEKSTEIKTTIQKVDNAVNSQDRASLIESLSADSVRRTSSEN